MNIKEFVGLITPPIVWTGLKRLFRQGRDHTGPEIRYTLLTALPHDLRVPALNNAWGTHLNESGDDRSVEAYLETFNLSQELQNPVVADNLLFIDTVISPLLPAEASVLDVGCGLGRYARFLRRPQAPTCRWRYAGVDRSADIVALSRKFYPEGEFRSSDGSNLLPCEDGGYDLVMASSMLQYTCDQWLDSLREMRRVARQFILISRLPMLRRSASAYCHQSVWAGRRREDHYLRLFNREEFEVAVMSLGCRLIARDYSAEIFRVHGLAEPAVCNLYLWAV
jgi:SAM-dependent methyltransferase